MAQARPPSSTAQFDAFVTGHRSVSLLDERELERLPVFAGRHAATSLVRIRRVLDEPGQDEEPWLKNLRAKLTHMTHEHGQLVIDVGHHFG